jgi:uncharacterized protein
MVDFCAADARLLPVGFVPLADPELAIRAAHEAVDIGCKAILVPSVPPPDISPTHPAFAPFWAHLEASDVPFMLHIGGGGRPLRRAWNANMEDVHGGARDAFFSGNFATMMGSMLAR